MLLKSNGSDRLWITNRHGPGLLQNELCVGKLVWNKQRYVKDPTSGKRLARLNPEASWIVQDVPALRIIEQSLWDEV
jgi:site-specific DNA recombinase